MRLLNEESEEKDADFSVFLVNWLSQDTNIQSSGLSSKHSHCFVTLNTGTLFTFIGNKSVLWECGCSLRSHFPIDVSGRKQVLIWQRAD